MNADILELSNELAYRAYIMNRDQIRKNLTELNFREYVALQRIAHIAASDGIYSGRAYLKDLAESLRLSMRQTSQMAGELKDRGLVTWSHDGDGSDGTYMSITDRGRELIARNEEILKKYYGNVIEKYGRDDMIQLLQMMKRLENVVQGEFEDMEGGETDDGLFE